MIGYYSEEEINVLGFGAVGKNVKISKTATLYNIPNIYIGNNVRIDNFCVLAISGTGSLRIGNHVQISAFNFMNGMEDVVLEDLTTTAPYVGIFSSTDDYSGNSLTNATVPKEFLGTKSAPVIVRRYSIIGSGSTIMPGVILEKGTAVAAHSFVNRSTKEFTIVGGNPAKFLKERERNLMNLEKNLENHES
ncbi:acyltransferase [Rufibacter glacialis]|uniref:Acyltransferase n=1 Tax=Rufibacter glacialis TaxID=1259555 RepID=A0A5M8QN18_9BACT|nr:acyltransferase [Rufibacter glacialis]KAA6437607.1 acyltransferase [Rufibacter glacialis]GGK57866.1 acetyltransferase [Rufibacter glacialis]